jgi:hypothetical protein
MYGKKILKNRKPTILNKSIAQSNYDIIQIDGDIIMNKYFVEDHLTFSEKGFYLYGSRVNTYSQFLTLFTKNKTLHFNFFKRNSKEELRTTVFIVKRRTKICTKTPTTFLSR